MNSNPIQRAAETIAGAKALIIGAGAGMGVDSGLPDFRGNAGFWKAYPPYAKLGLDFASMANPAWFLEDPAFAWGFYGHRLNLYRATRPHPGFGLLRRWGSGLPHGAFVFTSNVDGQFQRAGFPEERIVEVHGAIDWMQCTRECGVGIFSGEAVRIDVDPETFRAAGPLPVCPGCGALARPNILMFGDLGWDDSRTSAQHERLRRWLERVGTDRLVVVELGAGTAIPSVRGFSERLVFRAGATLIRINPREPQVPKGQVSIVSGALAALREIDAALDPRHGSAEES